MSKVVPAWKSGCLSADYTKYVCTECGLLLKVNDVGKGAYCGFYDHILLCPVCTANNQLPSDKLTTEQIENKKQEIKERLLENKTKDEQSK